MNPRAKTILLVALGIAAVAMILAVAGSDGEDQNAIWRGLSSILRLLTLIGRAF